MMLRSFKYWRTCVHISSLWYGQCFCSLNQIKRFFGIFYPKIAYFWQYIQIIFDLISTSPLYLFLINKWILAKSILALWISKAACYQTAHTIPQTLDLACLLVNRWRHLFLFCFVGHLVLVPPSCHQQTPLHSEHTFKTIWNMYSTGFFSSRNIG